MQRKFLIFLICVLICAFITNSSAIRWSKTSIPADLSSYYNKSQVYNRTEIDSNNANWSSTFNSTYDSKVSFNNTNLAYTNQTNNFINFQNFTDGVYITGNLVEGSLQNTSGVGLGVFGADNAVNCSYCLISGIQNQVGINKLFQFINVFGSVNKADSNFVDIMGSGNIVANNSEFTFVSGTLNIVNVTEHDLDLGVSIFGFGNEVYGDFSQVFGGSNIINNVAAFVIGIENKIEGVLDFAIGRQLNMTGDESISIGSNFLNDKNSTIMLGVDSPILEVNSTDIQLNNLAGAGNDYACLDSAGRLFRSNTAC